MKNTVILEIKYHGIAYYIMNNTAINAKLVNIQ